MAEGLTPRTPGHGSGPAVVPPSTPTRAVFVDRDGTLNPDLHYLSEPERLEILRGVGAGIRLLRAHGFRVICVTNQSGIARGFYTDEVVARIHARVNDLLAKEGTEVDAFYYCPHAPSERCLCRKPGTELLEIAQRDFRIDLAGSAIIGDRPLDVLAGQALGLLTVAVPERGKEAVFLQEAREQRARPDLVAPSFLSASLRLLYRG